METKEAASVLSALALDARLAIFRLLVRAGPEGVRAGEIASAVGAPGSTLSANLNILSHAGLIEGRREGRAIIYAARYDRMRDVLAFLLDDCCNGNSAVCAPLMDIATRAACCADDQAEHKEALT
ncbi:MAG: metalloregulator ArsR/SmtB family transcription factor [Pseudomonadota bacterium]|nr:metalloregulator ArsR/SmtB family transcription factor [Pseudomonadota bacterium]